VAGHQSVFYEDWRACLRAHYMHVIRVSDKVTEPTLKKVLLRVGFSEGEIAEMAVVARMHDVDTAPGDLPGVT
jgi:hypothetical protein